MHRLERQTFWELSVGEQSKSQVTNPWAKARPLSPPDQSPNTATQSKLTAIKPQVQQRK